MTEPDRSPFYDQIQKEDQRRRDHWRTGLFLLLLMIGFCGLDYYLHPQARQTQRAMELELKSLPLPSTTTEEHFSSGFRPGKGRAERKILTGMHEREICNFYSPLMTASGWRVTEDKCFPTTDAGHTLIAFRKNNINFRITYFSTDISGMTTYSLVSDWPAI